MATAIAKKIFVAADWGIAILKGARADSNWTDPQTGVKDAIFYMLLDGNSSEFVNEEGNYVTRIKSQEPGVKKPDALMARIPNGRAIFHTLPKKMMAHKETMLLMPIEEYEKLCTKVSSALTEGVTTSDVPN